MTANKTNKPDPKIELFHAELQESAVLLQQLLQAIELGNHERQGLQQLYDTIVSIKAGARLAGLAVAEQLVTTMQGLFEIFLGGSLLPDSGQIDMLLEAIESLLDISAAALAGDALDETRSTSVEALTAGLDAILAKQAPASTEKPSASTSGSKPGNVAPDAGVNPMRQMFQQELKERLDLLAKNLLAVEQGDVTPKRLEELMRTAHTIKGGARLCNLDPAVSLAHMLEDIFVAAQKNEVVLESVYVDMMLLVADQLMTIANAGVAGELDPELVTVSEDMSKRLGSILSGEFQPPLVTPASSDDPGNQNKIPVTETAADVEQHDSAASGILRISTEHMDHIIGLAGELNVETKQLELLRKRFTRVRRHSKELAIGLTNLNQKISGLLDHQKDSDDLNALVRKMMELELDITESIDVLDKHDSRSILLTKKIFNKVLSHRMRPFSEGLQGFHRLVRKVARSLGKDVVLDIVGESTQVDRDILDKLNAPLTHILQNAIDHGLEMPSEREQSGKPVTARVRVEAQHKGGMLIVTVEDDGRGINIERLRKTIVERRLATATMAAGMTDVELLEFLFLPNFTLKTDVTTLSGRGVGLDIVREMVKDVRGTAHIITEPGKFTRFELSLPITLSLIRCIVVEISGELYALPVGRVNKVVTFAMPDVRTIEGKQYLLVDGVETGLVEGRQVLDIPSGSRDQPEVLAAVMLGRGRNHYAMAVDRILFEVDLVERPLDPRLGKLQDVSAVSFLEDGSPAIILDVDDMLRSIERMISGDQLSSIEQDVVRADVGENNKRVLVVDDSLTIREVERNLLTARGYRVDVAVDGADGWNAVRLNSYDLIVTDIDMPRMDGIELVTKIRGEAHLGEVPIIIVSYKEREEDRQRGMLAGADYYLTKGSFQDDSFVEVVEDLIGTATNA